MASESENNRLATAAMGAAALAGLAAAGYAAARVRWVHAGLSEPRDPFEWKPGRGQTVLLRGANVVDVKRGQVSRERGVLFKDGEITDLIATRDLDKARADREFDCSGLFVMPGLVNCHVHSLMPGTSTINFDTIFSIKRQAVRNLEECAVHGVTTVRDVGTLSGVFNDLGGAVERLEVLGPRMVGCGVVLMARGGYPDHTGELPGFLSSRYGDIALYVGSPESAREAVREAVECGARYIKVFMDDESLFYGKKPLATVDDDSMKAVVDEAHKLGRRVGAHQTQLAGFRRALRLGIDDFEHVPMDEFLEPSDVKEFMAGDHNVTPTLSVGMVLGIAPKGHPARSDPEVEALQVERERVLRELAPSFCEPAVLKANMEMVRLYMEGSPSTGRGAKTRFDPERPIDSFARKNPNLRLLYEAGARICCGNDGGTPLSWPGMLSVEMRMLERFGLSRVDVLRSATLNAAKLLDMESELGTVEPGRHADMVLLSADPTKDLAGVERVEAVFRSGVLLHRGPAFHVESAV